jgi:hypothetical protein
MSGASSVPGKAVLRTWLHGAQCTHGGERGVLTDAWKHAWRAACACSLYWERDWSHAGRWAGGRGPRVPRAGTRGHVLTGAAAAAVHLLRPRVVFALQNDLMAGLRGDIGALHVPGACASAGCTPAGDTGSVAQSLRTCAGATAWRVCGLQR